MLPSSLAATRERALPQPAPEEAHTLLRECLQLIAQGLLKAARTASETATDLFEGKGLVSDGDELDFLLKRETWVGRFAETLEELFERRLSGQRRQGRRPDSDVSLSTLQVLNPFDQEKQAAIAAAATRLHRWAAKEINALDLRVAALLDEPVVRDLDNPFGPDYIIDAVGASARAMFPNPRIWRPFMERVLADVGPAVPKAYISANRFLADRGVLPDIQAALRARSELRPENDRDLMPLFTRLLRDAGSAIDAIEVEVPPILPGVELGKIEPIGTSEAAADLSASPDAGAAGGRPDAPIEAPLDGPLIDLALMDAPVPAKRQAAIAATAQIWQTSASAPRPAAEASPFPSLDPLLALGSSTPVFAVLNRWQSFDPQNEATRRALAAGGIDVGSLPLNRVPYLRAAMSPEGVTETDRITMDVIALLFDYIFRDPSIPESTRGIFGRLQVPVLKAALLDRAFFSDRGHPARRLLDRLAAGAAGAGTDKGYRIAFEGVAARVVERICQDYVLDLVVFDRADEEIRAFLEGEQRTLAHAIGEDVEAALEAEARESDRAHARALVRDRLAGLKLPHEVRHFAETAWADHLTLLRREHGHTSQAYRQALQTLDDLLWSITAKERTAQKARLTKMVPRIIGSLRQGCAAVAMEDARAKAFFETLYGLHIAAIRPRPLRPAVTLAAGVASPPAPHATNAAAVPAQSALAAVVPPGARGPSTITGVPVVPAGGAVRAPAAPVPVPYAAEAPPEAGAFIGTNNYHDYVSEMPVGTWVAFHTETGWVNARLQWVSPLRTKYIFTTRSRSSAFLYAPEDLAWALGVGRARLVVEPVPLFDRAVSAALDSLAAKKPAPPKAAAA